MSTFRVAIGVALVVAPCLLFAASKPAPDGATRDAAKGYITLAKAAAAKSGRDGMFLDIIYDQLIIAHARLGETDEAVKLAGALSTPAMRSRTLAGVAEIQAAAGDPAGAMTTLRLAQTGAHAKTRPASTMPQRQDEARAVGVAYAHLGKLAEADRVQATMQASAEKAEVLSAIGLARAKGGDAAGAKGAFAAALDALTKARDRFPFWTVEDVAVAQVQAGDTAGALETVRGVKDAAALARGLARVGVALAEAGDKTRASDAIAEARKALARVPEAEAASERVGFLLKAGVVAHKAGDAAGARDLMEEARKNAALDAGSRYGPRALMVVATAQAKIGDEGGSRRTLADARAAVEKLPDANGARTHALWALAGDAADAGHGAAARDLVALAMTAPAIDPTEVAFLCASLGNGLTRAEGAKADLAWVEKLASPEAKAMAYAGAAAGLLNSQDE